MLAVVDKVIGEHWFRGRPNSHIKEGDRRKIHWFPVHTFGQHLSDIIIVYVLGHFNLYPAEIKIYIIQEAFDKCCCVIIYEVLYGLS